MKGVVALEKLILVLGIVFVGVFSSKTFVVLGAGSASS